MELRPGLIVRSLAGKEKDGLYVVVAMEGKYVFLADGKHRPIGKPKRKNVRHIALTTHSISLNDTVTDKQLKRTLAEFAGEA